MGPTEEKPVVLITGCSEGGIGNALALAFAARGCDVVATARSLDAMPNLAHQPRITLQTLDLLSPHSIHAAVRAALDRFGRLDVLVNNAGVHCIGPAAELPLPALRLAFDTNFFGPVTLIQAVVPHMASRRRGKIVNVGSVSVLAPGAWVGGYAASKAALHALTDSLRLEVQPFGIEVVCVVPGAIRTNIGRSRSRKATPDHEWKLYKPFEGLIRQRVGFSCNPKSTPAQVFAERTVEEILKRNPSAWFSYGRFSTIARILYHLPIFIRDGLIKLVIKSP